MSSPFDFQPYTGGPPGSPRLDRHDVLRREERVYGGVKIGSAFFGWLTAAAVLVLLTATAVAGSAAVSAWLGSDLATASDQAAGRASSDPLTVGLVAGAVVLVVLFVAYYCGGYVAGRMARFDGARQGLAVWMWTVVIAVASTVAALVTGTRYDLSAPLDEVRGTLPRVSLDQGEVTTAVVGAVLVGVLASLGGAILGGVGGMRYHRRVDRTGLGL